MVGLKTRVKILTWLPEDDSVADGVELVEESIT